MAIEGQVQYQLVLAPPVPTRKRANPYQLLPLRPMGMGDLPGAHLPPVKAGYLNRNLTHLAPRHVLSFLPLSGVTLQSSSLSLVVPIPQVKALLTRTRSLLPYMETPTPVLRLKLRH